MLVQDKIRVVLSLPTSGHMVLRRRLEVKRLVVLQRMFRSIYKTISLCCLCHMVRATQHLEKYLKQGYCKERRCALEMLCNWNILAKNNWCGTPITVQSGDHIVPLRGPCHSKLSTLTKQVVLSWFNKRTLCECNKLPALKSTCNLNTFVV